MEEAKDAKEQELSALIERYLDEEWETVVADVDALVRVESTEDCASAHHGAPFGQGVRSALDAALGMAERMGLRTGEDEGYMGFADLPGETDRQLAMICHVDVVPAGEGWTVDPFAVTRREGWLMGRGVLDDKGPAVVALHAVNCIKRSGLKLPCTLRMLFGTDEESGMQDVPRYLATHTPPAFVFTPDADFPVGYGEKGQMDGAFFFKAQDEGDVLDLSGGMATNAVPSQAAALVRADGEILPESADVTVGPVAEFEGLARVMAKGVGGHAAWPEGTRSAIGVLADYLLEAGVGTSAERGFLRLASTLAHDPHGDALGIAAQDEHFGKLTVIGGTLRTEGGRFVLTVDARFPTTASAEEIEARLRERAAEFGAEFQTTAVKPVFLVDPESPAVQALLASYRSVFDDDSRPFTMGGGTYARCFPLGASFGPNRPWVEKPAWAGEEHMADEAVSEEVLKDAFRVYVRTLVKLASLDWEDAVRG